MVPSREVLSVALAAAVSQQNVEVAKEVAAIIKQNHGTTPQSLSSLVLSIFHKGNCFELFFVCLFSLHLGCDVDQIVSLNDLLASLREKFAYQDEGKVASFLLQVEQLENIR